MTVPRPIRAAVRPIRRIRRGFTTSDPDRARLRLAATTIATLVVVAAVLFALATVTAQPVTAVVPGIVVAMIASLAVRETAAGRRAVSIVLLIPSSVIAIALGAVVHTAALLADVVFVAVAVGAVLLRALGPRGTALGMVAFTSYFLSLFVKTTPAQLPATAGAVTAAALVTIAMRLLLRPRHADRDLLRMVSALGLRAARVLDVLAQGARVGGFDDRLRAELRSRVAASGSTASSVEEVLEAAGDRVIPGIGNDELGVRVFDFQLAIEHLATTAVGVGRTVPSPARRDSTASRLRGFADALRGPMPLAATAGDTPRPEATALAAGPQSFSSESAASNDEADATLERALAAGYESWNRVAFPAADAAPDRPRASAEDDNRDDADVRDGDDDDGPDDAPGDDRGRRLRDSARQAVQVAVAAALAIAVGTTLSSSRWYWAVIAAFVVYIGTSTRGEILSKGWQRVLGTLAGVIAGVVIAVLVGGNTALAVVLIVACLFLGVYLMSISSAIMIFFITTMLALIYGLLGMFSVDLLLVRLEETVAGAAIGVLVSYVVLPSSTRDAARSEVKTFLGQLERVVGSSVAALADADRGSPGVDGRRTRSTPQDAKALRAAFGALRTTTRPLTHGLTGVSDRSGSRRTLQTLAACEYHARALIRLSDSAGLAASPLGTRLEEIGALVRGNIGLLADHLGTRMSNVAFQDISGPVAALEDQAESLRSPDRPTVLAAARHLQAIDQSIQARARELGARRPGGGKAPAGH